MWIIAKTIYKNLYLKNLINYNNTLKFKDKILKK